MGDTSDKLSSLMSNAGSWSLSQDDSLQIILQEMSQNLLSRTSQTLDKIDNLGLTATRVQIKLDTAHNNLLLLSNTKFVEARVYDDSDEVVAEDVNDNKDLDSAPTEEQTITEALKLGLNLVDTAFEKVEVENSDSESEDDSNKNIYVLQPINSYHTRQLPAVIGSTEWFDDDHIGLGDDNASKDDEESESESEEEDVTDEKHDVKDDESEYSDSETDEQVMKADKPVSAIPAPSKIIDNNEEDSVSDFSDDDDDDDLFRPAVKKEERKNNDIQDSPLEIEDTQPEQNETKEKRSFADELAAKLGGGTKSSQPLEKTNADADAEEAPVKVDKKTVKSKSVLFGSDSESDDDDLFSSSVALPKKAVVPKISSTTTIKEIKIEQEKTVAQDKPDELEKNEINEETKPKTLFSHSSDEDDDDFFADLKIPSSSNTTAQESKKAPINNMFDDKSDSEDDIFADLGGKLTKPAVEKKSAPEPNKSKPVGGISMFGGLNPSSLFSSKKKDKPEDEVDKDEEDSDSDDDIFDSPKLSKQGKVNNNFNQEKVFVATKDSVDENITIDPINIDSALDVSTLETVTKNRPKARPGRRPPTRAGRKRVEDISVFGDGDNNTEDDNSGVDQEIKEPEKKKAPVGGVSLFGGFNPASALLSRKSVEQSEKTKVFDEEPDENLFSSSINTSKDDFTESKVETKQDILSNDDVDDDSFFSEPPPMDSISKNEVKDIFADSDDDDDLFGDLMSKNDSKEPLQTSATKSSLFDFDNDDDEDDDDLFASLIKSK